MSGVQRASGAKVSKAQSNANKPGTSIFVHYRSLITFVFHSVLLSQSLLSIYISGFAFNRTSERWRNVLTTIAVIIIKIAKFARARVCKLEIRDVRHISTSPLSAPFALSKSGTGLPVLKAATCKRRSAGIDPGDKNPARL